MKRLLPSIAMHKTILLIGFLALAIAFLLPPWQVPTDYAQTGASERHAWAIDFEPLWNPPHSGATMYGLACATQCCLPNPGSPRCAACCMNTTGSDRRTVKPDTNRAGVMGYSI